MSDCPATAEEIALAATPATARISVTDLVFGQAGGRELKARLYAPVASGRSGALVALVDVHGGAWYRGAVSDGAHYAQRLAELGVAVLSIEFRDAAVGGEHPQAGQDITAAVRYLRIHAAHLGVNPAQIGLIGSSSGGHLALLAAVLPESAQHSGTDVNLTPPGSRTNENVERLPEFAQAAPAITAQVIGVAALWPVSDPLYRYLYARRTERPELVAGHDAYFKTIDAMHDASVPRIVAGGLAECLPPLFVVQPGDDKNVPREMTQDLVAAWESQGGRVSCAFYPGMPHGFACREGGYTEVCIQEIAGFFGGCLVGVAGQKKRNANNLLANQ